MKKFYINKNNKKLYTLDELSLKIIQFDTFVKEASEGEWTWAKDVPDFEVLLKKNTGFRHIKKAMYAKLDHIWNIKRIILTFLYFVFMLYVFSIDINVSIKIPFLVLGIGLIIYPLFISRYIRIYEEECNDNKKNLKSNLNKNYYIQECYSFKKHVTDLNREKIKWKRTKYKRHTSEKTIENLFKIITKVEYKNKSHKKIVFPPRLANNKSKISDFIWEKNSLRHFFNKFSIVLIVVGIFLFVSIFSFGGGLIKYYIESDESTQKVVKFYFRAIFQVVLILCVLYCAYMMLFYFIANKRYLRVVKKYNRHCIQSYTTRKKLSQIIDNPNIKWVDLYKHHGYTYEKAKQVFHDKVDGL